MRANKNVGGFTLLEAVMAFSFTTLLILLALSASMNISKIISAQESVIRTDQQAQKAFAVIAKELGGAILPARVDGASLLTKFEDINDEEFGFGGSTNGSQGDNWRTSLLAGMDNLAYVTLVDAQEVGDVSDGNDHYQVGQNRFGVPYLGANAAYARDAADGNKWKLYVRNLGESVNVLTILNPNSFDSLAFEVIESPDTLAWSAMNSGWQNITAFMAIRFVPMTYGGSQPYVINEAESSSWPGFNGGRVDLDGNGQFNDTFHIGKLQLLYSGGNLIEVNPSGRSTNVKALPQVVVNLTSNTVLRKTDRSEPIFTVESPAAGGGGNDISLLRVRLLLLDNQYVTEQYNDTGGQRGFILRPQPYTNGVDVRGRWYETYVSMNHMNR